jgi:hypothetical protein
VSWLATETLTAQLPDPGGLRAAAYNLRHAGDTLGAHASATRGVADAIGPGVWQDEASGRAKAILGQLDTELSTGSSAMYQAADALDSLAGYVSGQQWRYEETGKLLEGLARDPIGTIAHHELAEAEQLIEERRSIEQGVSAAMAHASDIINQAASRATRYHGGQSFWSSLEQDAVKSAKSVWHTYYQFERGVWDGTYDMVKGTVQTVWSLTVLGAKLSPERMLLDPAGWEHDYEHAFNTGWTTTDEIAHHKKQFIETLLNLKDLKTDPAHWFGELVPLIASIVITKGAASLAAKGADSTEAIDAADATANAAVKGAEASQFLPKTTVEHVFEGWWNAQTGKGIGLHSAPNGIVPPGRRIIFEGLANSDGSWSAKVQFQTSEGWMPPQGKFSTMFPKSWSKDQTIQAIQDAYNNRYLVRYAKNGIYWEGKYNDMTIGGWLNDADHLPVTAYPIPAQDATDPSLTTSTPPPD